jgi:chromosome segregation ATPase
LSQEKNLHGLVEYAKTIRAELEDYVNKVETSEKIV